MATVATVAKLELHASAIVEAIDSAESLHVAQCRHTQVCSGRS